MLFNLFQAFNAMPQLSDSVKSFYQSACLFEASLLPLAFILGWVVDIAPFANLYFTEAAYIYGVAGTLPLLLAFVSLQYASHPALQRMRDLVMLNLVSRLYTLHWSDLLVLASIAGIAEECLFRGVLQPWLEIKLGIDLGLLVSSVIFGLVHAITPFYALCAGLVSIYLGLALDYGGERNLLIPIIIHGLYDFVAFVALIRFYRQHLTAAEMDNTNR